MGQSAINFAAHIASTCAGLLRTFKNALARSSKYRPEAHYMRGPRTEMPGEESANPE